MADGEYIHRLFLTAREAESSVAATNKDACATVAEIVNPELAEGV